jgi:hypothetical protein
MQILMHRAIQVGYSLLGWRQLPAPLPQQGDRSRPQWGRFPPFFNFGPGLPARGSIRSIAAIYHLGRGRCETASQPRTDPALGASELLFSPAVGQDV